MRQLIKDKANEAGLPNLGDTQDFASRFEEIEVDVNNLQTEEERRAAKVKNISLRLLGVSSPQEVLDLFEEEFIVDAEERAQSLQPGADSTIEELFMFLYFFKTQIRSLRDAEALHLIKSDYRVNLLIQMIFAQYEPDKVEFSYQVSTVLSLSILTEFYGLQLTVDQ